MSSPRDPEWWEVQGEQWKLQPEEEEAKFRVGDKVVCINASMSKEQLQKYSAALVKWQVYVIREVSPDRVHVCGILGSIFDVLVDREDGFNPDRFMLLSEYRRQRQNAARIRQEFEQMEEFRKLIAYSDAHGNPRSKKPRKVKTTTQNHEDIEPSN